MTASRKKPVWGNALQKRVAFHEAGHAVIGRVLGLSVQHVSTEASGDALGHVAHASCNRYSLGPILKTELEWRERDGEESAKKGQMFIPRDAAFYAHLLTILAGAAAEKHFCGGPVHHNASRDNRHIREILRFFPTRRPRLKRMAEALVRRHRNTIWRVARHLSTPRTISGSELETIITTPASPLRRQSPSELRPRPFPQS